ncbi:MAG: MFS transporter [Opitutaceae bacterium]|nr:MFS transporter [Opitutaceae bacterium]
MTTTNTAPGSGPTARALPSGAWLAVGLLWLAGGSNYLTRTMLTTMRGSIMEEIPMSEAQFGLLTSGFLWVYAFVSPFGGFFADRFSRRLVVICSIFAWSTITWLTSYVKTFEQFLLLRALLGLSEAFYIPAAVALIIDFHRGPTRALAAGIHTTGLIFGSTIGGLGGWLAEDRGWSYAYTVIGLPNLAFGLLLYFFLRDAPREHQGPVAKANQATNLSFLDAVVSLARTGPFYYVISCWCLQGAVGWMIIGWMPTHMREQFSLGQGAAGFSALGYVYVTQTIGLLIGGFWSDRWSATQPRARIIIPAMAFLLAAPAFWMTGYSNLIFFTILSLVLWGLAEGFLGANMMPIICLVVDSRYRATALGVLNCFTAICGGLAIYGVGALRDAKIGITMILVVAGVGVLLCGVTLWLVNAALKRKEKPAAA